MKKKISKFDRLYKKNHESVKFSNVVKEIKSLFENKRLNDKEVMALLE